MSVDSAIVTLIAREIFEGFMFTTTHVKAVTKNELLNEEEKKICLRRLWYGLALGGLAGLIISLSVGFALSAALHQIEDADWGIEIGEGISKAIAGIFVIDLSLKIPKWLGISNYVQREEESVKAETGIMLSASLFWNVLREASEAGILTAITVLLASYNAETTVISVFVGIAAAIAGGGLIMFGILYFNRLASALLATVITMMLATGLLVGAAHEFEEAFEHTQNTHTDYIYEVEKGDPAYAVLKAMRWCGISNSLTVLTLIVWVLTVVGLCTAQVWNNYLGYDFCPACVTKRGRSNTNVAGGDVGDGEDNNVIVNNRNTHFLNPVTV